jgi:hypothetical protein
VDGDPTARSARGADPVGQLVEVRQAGVGNDDLAGAGSESVGQGRAQRGAEQMHALGERPAADGVGY